MGQTIAKTGSIERGGMNHEPFASKRDILASFLTGGMADSNLQPGSGQWSTIPRIEGSQNRSLAGHGSRSAEPQTNGPPSESSRLWQKIRNGAGTIGDAIADQGIGKTLDEALEPTPGTGAASRFFLGLGRAGKGLVQFPLDVIHEAIDPENPELNALVPGGSAAERFIVRPQVEEYRKAREVAEQGRALESFGHSVAAAVPLFGPLAAGIGERAGSGDIAGALGEAVGFLAPYAKGRGSVGRGKMSATPKGGASVQPAIPVRTLQPPPSRVPRTTSKTAGKPARIPPKRPSNEASLRPSTAQNPPTKQLSLVEKRAQVAKELKERRIQEEIKRAHREKVIDGTMRAARREALRTEGVPTSQKPVAQTSNRGKKPPTQANQGQKDTQKAGRQYFYEVKLPLGQQMEKIVTNQLRDKAHPPHVEAGIPKRPQQVDWAERRRHYNSKTKVTPRRN